MADPLYRQVLDTRIRDLGPDHHATLQATTDLGESLRDQAKYVEAEPLFRKVLAIRMRVPGEVHVDTAASFTIWPIA